MTWSPIERPFEWQHLTETTQITSAPGILHTITINRPDTTASAIITVYDGIGVTTDIIAIISMDKIAYVIPQTLIYDVAFATGLYIVFSDEVTADITVSYNG